MKKFLSILLAIVMLLQTAAFAAPMAVTTSDSAVEMPMFVEENEEIALSAESYPTDLASMRKRAEAIVNYKWTPSTDIATWNGNPTTDGKTVFEKGVPVVGMPYTLFTWEFGSDSLLSLAQYKTKAESNYTGSKYCNAVGEQRVGPVYGSCCATFVSEVFGGSFMNGDSPRYDGCMNIMDSAYSETITNATISQIREGDALVKDDYWHIIWVSEITDTKMVIYEQTYPVARKVTINKPSGNATLVYNGYSYPYIVRSKELETMSLSSGGLTLSDLKAKFQENSYWNGGNADLCTSFPCKCKHNSSHTAGSSSVSCTCNSFWGSIQCAGFALKIIYDVYKQDCTVDWVKKTSSSYIDQVKPGDYIRYGGHSVVVVAVDGDYITVGECNWGSPCRINWTRTESKSHFKSGFSHVYVAPYALPGSDASDSDSNPDSVDHECSSCVTVTNTGGYVSGVDSVLRVRTGPGTNYSVAFTMNPDTAVVIKTMCNGWYFVVDVGGNSGWVSGQYITITNGGYDIDTNYPTPFNAYTKNGQTTVYTSVSGTTSGTEYISATDICTINEVYTNGWLKVTYPLDSGGTKTRYCPTGDFFYDGSYTNIHSETTTTSKQSYTHSILTNKEYEVIASGKTCTIVGEYGDYYQAIATGCSSDTGKFLVWIEKSAFSTAASTPDIRLWVADSAYGEIPSSFKTGNRYWFCVELYDSVSGKLWNSVSSDNYTLKLTFYNPDGSVKYSSGEVQNNDKYWISSVFDTPGTYKYGVELTGDYLLSGTKTFTVQDNPKNIHVSTSSVSLDLDGTKSKTIYVWTSGYYSGSTVINWSTNNGNVTCSWGDWNSDNKCPLTITGLKPGTTTISVSVKDKSSGVVLHSVPVNVTITESTKPTASISVTNKLATSQTVTLSMSDNSGIAGYYWGTSSTYSNNTYTSTSSTSVSKTISSAGTYYFNVKDIAGNISNTQSITFYKTTFNANGGTVSPSYVIIKSGNSITLPTPTKDGYTFLGWSTSSSGSVAYTAGAKYSPNSSITLYAVWQANAFTVKYNANGGSGSMADSVFQSNTTAKLPANQFTKTGYRFSLWSTVQFDTYEEADEYGKKHGLDVFHLDDATVFGHLADPGETVTLYAVWKPNTYTVKYNANGGSGTMSDSTHTYDVAKALNANTFTRTGYTFLGWSQNAFATTATYIDRQSVKNLTSANGATVNLYAIWSKIPTYTVSYDANGGTGAPASQTKTHNVALTLSSTTPVKTGYTFKAWETSSGVVYKPSASYTSNSSEILIAHWTPHTYTVKYNANGGSGTMSDSAHTYDVAKALNTNTFTRTGYTFLGWSTSASATTATYTDKQSVKNLTSTNGATVTLYAVWKANTYTVKYNANGGSGTMSDSAHTYDVAKALNANTFARTGYTFLGWSTSASATTATYTDKQSVKNLTSTNGATVTLYAVWKANTYTVKYNANGGSGSMPNSTHTYDTAKALTANAFTRSGYTFLGWSTSSSATTATYTDKQSVKNLTSTNGEVVNLYAVWAEKGKYIISFDTNGAGTTIGAQTKYHDEDLKLLSYIPPRTGYTFKEWLATNGVAYAPGSIYTANSTTTLVAQWRPNTYTVKYNANGGSGTMSDSTHTYDVAKTLNANTFARTGHTFLGWSTSASATTATYTDKQSVKNLTSTNGATVNLYAIWSKISTYTVSYDSNGGTGAPASQTKIHGTNLSLSSAIPLKTGYKFVNWKASDNALYNPGDTYDKNSQTTMVAQWKAITYKVKFDANGGEGTMGHNLCVYDFENSLDPNRFEREGYEFVGWSTNKSATKAEFTDKEKVLNLTTVDGDVVLLYAVWRKVETFEIEIWVINEDDIDEIVLTKRKGDIINLGDYKPRKTGYTFIAWSDMGAEKTYSPNDKYIVTDDAFIVSGMQPNTYIVYFDALGGIVMQDFKSVKFDSAYGELPIPTRNGYDFDGWYTESNGGKNVTEETIVATPDKHTLYARWIEKNISPVAITLNKASATLEIGDTTALTATVAPSNATNKNVTWKSSDKNVATVANGVVTAVGKGTATITVTTVDGNKTATCTVTVTKPEEPNPEAKATVTLSNETGRAGDKVSVIVSLNTDEIINTIGVSGIAYDKSILTFDSFTQYDEVKDISILSSFDEKMMTVTIALEEPQSFNGKLFEINFIINENAEDGKSDIDLSSMIKLNSTEIVVNDIAGSVTVISELLGDINHDDCVDMNDAVLLLQHSMFPHLYPIEYKGNADFTEDGNIDMNDAVRLLQYSMFPNLYPIE